MTIEVKVIADSINSGGERITTMQLKYQRLIHSEFMTHRVFSRNASSSRAIPVIKMLKAVWTEPAMPIHWGSNKPGMQAGEELPPFRRLATKILWKVAGRAMCGVVWIMSKLGVHKQIANRLLEPWLYIHVVITSTEWENFFALRCHPAAQPEFQELAKQMRLMRSISSPVKLDDYDWHLPYIDVLERGRLSTMEAIQVSAARCCRVSYLNHEGRTSTLEQDVARYESLVNAVPPHMSPVEHQAMALPGLAYANFRGWASHRWLLEEAAIHKVWDSPQTS